LKLLASEIHARANARHVPCDLVTGEERRFAIDPDHPAAHVSCTVEMVQTHVDYEVTSLCVRACVYGTGLHH
jgi:ATP-dependent RNA helicase SUPV3L1/SUV3